MSECKNWSKARSLSLSVSLSLSTHRPHKTTSVYTHKEVVVMSAMSYNGAAIIGALFVVFFFFFPFSVVVSLRRRNAAFVLRLFLRDEIALCHHRTLSHQNNNSLSVCACVLSSIMPCVHPMMRVFCVPLLLVSNDDE